MYVNNPFDQWVFPCQRQIPIYTVLFADVQLVLAEDKQDLTHMLNKLVKEYSECGLKININKTKYMEIEGKKTYKTKKWKYRNCKTV